MAYYEVTTADGELIKAFLTEGEAFQCADQNAGAQVWMVDSELVETEGDAE